MTEKQKKDLECIKYFIPESLLKYKITERDIEDFYKFDTNGIKPKFETDGYKVLITAKERRGMTMRMYEEGVLDGSMPYFTLLGGYAETIKRKWWQLWKQKTQHLHKPIPRYVVDFMKKEMFKGGDSDTIETCYKKLLSMCCEKI